MVIGLRGETHADQKLALRDNSLGLSAPRPGVRSRAGAARQNAVRRCIVHHATEDSLCGMGTTKRRRYSRAGCNPSDNFACVHFTQRKRAFWYALGAGIALLLAFPVVFFWFVAPANEVFLAAPPSSIPANWMEMRRSWENGHAIRFVLQLAALSLLVLSVVLETRENTTTA